MHRFKKISAAFCAVFFSGIVLAASSQKEVFIAATFNVRVNVDKSPNSWAERLPRCQALLKKIDADILGLQEPKIEQVESLIRNSEYDFIGGGRDDFGRKGEFSCIFYRKSRFVCLQSGTFGLSGTPDIPGVRSWGSAFPRIATWGLFRDRKTGKEFVYYNTHLDHVSEAARCEGIKLLVAHARKHASDKPIMISGDFNSHPGSETYRTAQSLLNDSASVSATPHTGSGKTFHGWGKSTVDQPIDFIFVSSEFQVLSHRTDNTTFDGFYASDHYPVVVEMTLL
ncbi:MAG: endonuclease/exonuclease/phosphatase family protein [Victivallaceae bacterium]|nr:endonuclease/exonuclease/phosphatase family protein [Victivallaceae bacterium]